MHIVYGFLHLKVLFCETLVQFLVRQPRNGRIPVEKMDLMNTVNQLLLELNKLKSEKVALEEEVKTQRRCQVRDRVKRTVTARDVAMAASNKVTNSLIPFPATMWLSMFWLNLS
jgi:hypothetical protein